jgi:NAD(P)H-dependent FMN reductase
MLDTEYKNYFYKAVAFAGVSIGMFGGARCIEALQPVVRELHMTVVDTDVNFAKIGTIFDDSGKLIDESYIRRVENTYRELIWLATTMKNGRDNIKR